MKLLIVPAMAMAATAAVPSTFYSVHYHPRGRDVAGEIRSLSSLADVATWRKVAAGSNTVSYLDSKHKYLMRCISDGANISAVAR